ncbi:MAG: ParB/RepB/Spo0J family partition protein [Leptospirales bacterium]
MAQRGLNTNPFNSISKGREALFEGVEAGVELLEIPIDSVDPDPDQVRRSLRDDSFRSEEDDLEKELQSLAESIETFGLAQPIHVFRSSGRHIVMFGERRLLAAKRAGLKSIAAVVHAKRPDNITEKQLAENLNRKDLTDLEIYEALRRVFAERPDLKRKDLATLLGKTPQWVSRFMLLERPENRQLIEEEAVSGTAVLAHFLSLPEKDRTELLEKKRGQGPITYSDIVLVRQHKRDQIRQGQPENYDIRNSKDNRERLEEANAGNSHERPTNSDGPSGMIPKNPDIINRREKDPEVGSGQAVLRESVAHSEDSPPYGQEIPIGETRGGPKQRPAEEKDPVVVVDLPLGVWKKILFRLGLDPKTPTSEIKRRLMKIS